MISRSAQKHSFYVEMAKLLAAGFGIREAAEVLKETRLPDRDLRLLNGLENGLAEGKSIASAFATAGPDISEIEQSIISAGERGGRLAPAFQHLAEYFGLLSTAQRDMLRSILYPALVLHLGIFISVVPSAIMSDTDGVWSNLGIALLVAYVAGFLLFLCVRALDRLSLRNAKVDALINRVPLIGPVRRNLAMARFAKVYHTCLLAGLTISETTAMSASAAHSGSILAAGKILAERANGGDLLGPEMIASEAFPRAFSRSYSTAEVSGSLDKDMERWSNLYQREAETSIRTMSVVLPKIVGALVMLFVAWKIVGFWSDYYGKLETLGE